MDKAYVISLLMSMRNEENAAAVNNLLGTIDMKYDAAITTSCGMLDYLVVQTIETDVCLMFYNKCGQCSHCLHCKDYMQFWNEFEIYGNL